MGYENSGNRLTTRHVVDFSKLTIKCYNYLLHNFHKFTIAQKIEIAKAVVMKAMPMPEGSGNNQNVTIIIQKPNAVSDSDTNIVIHRERTPLAEGSQV